MSTDTDDIRRDVGNLRETVGMLRGEMRAHKDILVSINDKIDENRKSNKEVHSKLESKVTDIKNKIVDIETKLTVDKEVTDAKRRMAEWGRSIATGSVAGVFINGLINWLQRH